jgi:TIR domain
MLMSHIFISYRRDDSTVVSGRIYDRLVETFGRNAIFKDVDNIPLGVNFADYLAGVLAQTSVQLVIIGPRWFDADSQGRRRLDDPGDFVRLEIETAIQRGIPIIPLMVNGATLPAVDHLPPSLRNLPLQNGVGIRGADFERDMGKVSATLARWVKPLPNARNTPGLSLRGAGLLYGIILTLYNLIVAAIGALLIGSMSRDSSASGAIALTFTGLFLVPAMLLCFLAGRAAARRSGRASTGAGAGLFAAALGGIVGGALFGALVQTPAASSGATGSSSSIQIGGISGAIVGLVLALIIGPLFGALGGLSGRGSSQRKALSR